MRIRPARHDDLAAMRVIGAEGGSPDADERYLDHVATHGRLLVATHTSNDDDAHHDRVVGFGGSVAIGDAAMVTDLFVDPQHRGTGVGAALLAAVTDGHERRLTFSSTHPAALAAYTRAGLVAQWDLLTLHGVAPGGGPSLTDGVWRHDRRELVEYFRSCGAVVGADQIVQIEPAAANGEPLCTVWRMVSEQPEADAAELLTRLPAGSMVQWSLPAPHPLAGWLQGNGFSVVDRDVFCATDGVRLVPQLSSVHRGLL